METQKGAGRWLGFRRAAPFAPRGMLVLFAALPALAEAP